MISALRPLVPLACLLALGGCKSKVADSTGAMVKSCGAGEVLVNAGNQWACQAASTLSVRSAQTVPSAISVSTATVATTATSADVANQASALGTGSFQLGNAVALGAALPPDAGAVELAVEKEPVLIYGNGYVATLLRSVTQTARVDAAVAQPGIILSQPITLASDARVRVRAEGVVSGDGYMTAPTLCLVRARVLDQSSNVVGNEGVQVAPGFSSTPDAGEQRHSGLSSWYLEDEVALSPGSYTVELRLEVASASGSCTLLPTSAGVPPTVATMEAL